MLPFRNFCVKEVRFPTLLIPIGSLLVRKISGRRSYWLNYMSQLTRLWFLTNFETAELIKYAANAFLALKISYANAIAKLSESIGADALKVLEGIGADKRIGNMFLSPAPVMEAVVSQRCQGLISIAKDNDYPVCIYWKKWKILIIRQEEIL